MTDSPQVSSHGAVPSGVSPPRRRIVVGVDGSDGSVAALSWALAEARMSGAGVHAVLAGDHHPSWGDSGLGSMVPTGFSPEGGALPGELLDLHPSSDPGPIGGSTDDTARASAARAGAMENVLDGAIGRATQDDAGPASHSVMITQEVVEGHPAKVLVDMVSDSDLLVIGSRGHGGFAGSLLGSVSHHVVAHARCPVVVVPDPR